MPGLPTLTQHRRTLSQVRWTVNPLGSPIGTPNSTVWHIPNQNPTGPGNAQVAWSQSGAVGFCGTGQLIPPLIQPDESAFSQSLDNGNNWAADQPYQHQLIYVRYRPFAGFKEPVYGDLQRVRCGKRVAQRRRAAGLYWGRLLTVPTDTNRVILRLSPNYQTDYTLYAIEIDNNITVNPKPLVLKS